MTFPASGEAVATAVPGLQRLSQDYNVQDVSGEFYCLLLLLWALPSFSPTHHIPPLPTPPSPTQSSGSWKPSRTSRLALDPKPKTSLPPSNC